jgi:hypothetical protein
MTRYANRKLKYSLNENFNLLPYVEWDRFVTLTFRNMANVCPRILQENDDLKHEVNILHNQIEELEQYGRRTSLRFHVLAFRSIYG